MAVSQIEMSAEQKEDEENKTVEEKEEDPNRKIMNLWQKHGPEVAAAAMFEHPKTKKKLTYAEMRGFFG